MRMIEAHDAHDEAGRCKLARHVVDNGVAHRRQGRVKVRLGVLDRRERQVAHVPLRSGVLVGVFGCRARQTTQLRSDDLEGDLEARLERRLGVSDEPLLGRGAA